MCIYQTGFLKKVVATELKGCPSPVGSPAATASTGTLIFDLGRSPFPVHVYSIPTECFFLPWTSLVARRSPLTVTDDVMDSSPSTPYFSQTQLFLLLSTPVFLPKISRRRGESGKRDVDPILNIKCSLNEEDVKKREILCNFVF